MTLRVLISQPRSPMGFRITQATFDAALARAAPGLPPVGAIFHPPDDPEFARVLADCTALLGWRIPTDIVRKPGERLRLVQLTSAGIEHLLPLDWLPPDVTLANASGIHARKLEEWATMVLLMLHGHMPHFATAQRRHLWSKRHSSRIAGKTALIYGAGGLGRAVARAARSLGVSCLGVRQTPYPVPEFDSITDAQGARPLLGKADFVILAMPLTPRTKGFADAGFFAAMRRDAGFANFGRGELVDQEALSEALRRDAIAGAIVDVTTPEPLSEDAPLWDVPGLMITPHVSCDDPETYMPDVLDLLLDNLARLLEGRALRNAIDPASTY